MDLNKLTYGGKDFVNAVIEIPYGSSVKYEVDKDTGTIVVDRVMYSAVYYPANYGFIPQTLADDGDPMDILVLNQYPLQAGSVIKCRLIGVLIMEDESGMDEKLLALPLDKIDPSYSNIKDYSDLSELTLSRIKNFFETYKMLEPKKWVKLKNFEGREKANEILEKSIKNYKAQIRGKTCKILAKFRFIVICNGFGLQYII